MTDLKIKRGLSSAMFIAPNRVNPRLVIEEGFWYLCYDTAELFLGIKNELGFLTLKKINASDYEDPSAELSEIKQLLDDLRGSVKSLEETTLFVKINNESELPSDFDAEDFNPNITYYIQLTENRISTYIFDKGAKSYMCTNNIDDLVIRAMVSEAIEITLEGALSSKIPQMVRQSLENNIIHGGHAV